MVSKKGAQVAFVKMNLIKKTLLVTTLTLTAPAAWAQGCSVCTKTAQGLEDKSAKGLNGGILYLAFLPLGIIGTVGYVWWRGRQGGQA